MSLKGFVKRPLMPIWSRNMKENLLARVDYHLRKRRLDRGALQYFLNDHGISYPIAFLNALAGRSDIYLIANFLEIPASDLFEVTEHKGHFVMAVFEEEWPSVEGRIQISKSEAYKRIVHDRELKGENNEIRRQIRLSLQGLIAPKRPMVACEYPDCDACNLRCKITGHSLGPED